MFLRFLAPVRKDYLDRIVSSREALNRQLEVKNSFEEVFGSVLLTSFSYIGISFGVRISSDWDSKTRNRRSLRVQ